MALTRTPRPELTDVVGTVAQADDTGLVVCRAGGQAVRIERESIVAARVIPPTPFRAADLVDVAAALITGRPGVHTARLGDWTLRSSAGFTRRANSCLTVAGDPDAGLATALDQVSAFYAGHARPAQLLVRIGDPLVEAAHALGWKEPATAARALVLHTTLDTVHAAGVALDAVPRDSAQIVLGDAVTQEWLDLVLSAEPDPSAAVAAAARHVLGAAPVVTTAAIRSGDRLVAAARGFVVGRWAGIDSLTVVPEHRGQGYALLLTCALARWAASHGVRRVFLEVETDNEPALRLYRGLGFGQAYEYGYLVPGRPS